MPEYNKPLSLLRTRTYPGYQFYADMTYEGQSPERCMKYVILTVIQWLRERIGSESAQEALNTPDPKDYRAIGNADFLSCHFNEGYSLDVTSLLQEGIWAATLKEPDVERLERRAVIGRFFVTEIGIHLLNDRVELGVKIDVLDPIDTEREVPHAFRPAFIRRLFATKSLHIHQVEPLKYNRPTPISSAPMLKRLENLIGNPDNQMPCILFTYACQRKNVRELVEKLDKSLGLTDSPDSFSARISQMSLVPETLEIGDFTLPYDADYVAAHTFGYGRVFVVSERMFASFRRRIDQNIQPGDALWLEPLRFGGASVLYAFDTTAGASQRERVRSELLRKAHEYSKNKAYSFGEVVFERAARRLEMEGKVKLRLQELHNVERAEADRETSEIYRQTEELLALYDEEKKGVDAECERLRQENQSLFGRIASMEARLERRIAQDGVFIQTADIEEFYEDEQRDLIINVLTEAGKTYCAQDSRAEELLQGIVAKNTLTGEGLKLFERLKAILFRNKNITESDVSDLRALGFEVSRHSNNHYKLVFKGDKRYSFTLASTGSDSRGMKNSHSEITKRLSVYK